MSPGLVLLLTFVVLVNAVTLLATLGRRHRSRTRPLPPAKLAALTAVVGSSLASLVEAAVRLKQQVEDVAARGHELLVVESQLGSSGPSRPLWRQIEDANFGHQRSRMREATSEWLARFDALASNDRQIVDQLGLDVAPLRELVTGPEPEPLQRIQARLERAIACLVRFERELADYRPGLYR